MVQNEGRQSESPAPTGSAEHATPRAHATLARDGEISRQDVAELDDAALVSLAQQGRFDAFDQLVSRHEQRVYTTARRILRHDQDAEDAMQTTFLSAMQHLGRFRGEASFATWITRIAANTSLKILRKRGRSVDFSSADDPKVSMADMPSLDQRLADLGPDLLDRIEQRELGRILDAAADALDDKHRVVFVLRDMEGLSVKETAQQLNISESNVKIRLMRARLKLRQWLCEQLHDCAEL